MGYTFDEGLDDVWVVSWRCGVDTGSEFTNISSGTVGQEFALVKWKPFRYLYQVNAAATHAAQKDLNALTSVGSDVNSLLVKIDGSNTRIRGITTGLGANVPQGHDDARFMGWINKPFGVVAARNDVGTATENNVLISVEVPGKLSGPVFKIYSGTIYFLYNRYPDSGVGAQNIIFLSQLYHYDRLAGLSGTDQNTRNFSDLTKHCHVWQMTRGTNNDWKLWIFSTCFKSDYPVANAHTDGVEVIPTMTTTANANYDTVYVTDLPTMRFKTSSSGTRKLDMFEISLGGSQVTRAELKQLWLNMKARNGIA